MCKLPRTWQVRLAFVSVANQSIVFNLSDYQLSQTGFVQPDPSSLLCLIESYGHRYAQAVNPIQILPTKKRRLTQEACSDFQWKIVRFLL